MPDYFLVGFLMTRETARSTFPMAFPNMVPTARPTWRAFSDASGTAANARLDVEAACLATVFTFAAVDLVGDFFLRSTRELPEAVFEPAPFLFPEPCLAEVTDFLAAAFFKDSPFLPRRLNEEILFSAGS